MISPSFPPSASSYRSPPLLVVLLLVVLWLLLALLPLLHLPKKHAHMLKVIDADKDV